MYGAVPAIDDADQLLDVAIFELHHRHAILILDHPVRALLQLHSRFSPRPFGVAEALRALPRRLRACLRFGRRRSNVVRGPILRFHVVGHLLQATRGVPRRELVEHSSHPAWGGGGGRGSGSAPTVWIRRSKASLRRRWPFPPALGLGAGLGSGGNGAAAQGVSSEERPSVLAASLPRNAELAILGAPDLECLQRRLQGPDPRRLLLVLFLHDFDRVEIHGLQRVLCDCRRRRIIYNHDETQCLGDCLAIWEVLAAVVTSRVRLLSEFHDGP
mmetsp:Transcript_120711/g.341355  ORF Transcript_120711/g.341355 Transcript_120711/m.341355 type:complete len:272 (-) Transcript_120711:394-1209(-)